jgi:hypothetical protein
MYLTGGFIASVPSKSRKQYYCDNQVDYKTPRLQVLALHPHPSIVQARKLFGDKINVRGTHGFQWMTISDGIHSMYALLPPDPFNPGGPSVVESGKLKEKSIFELNLYVVGEEDIGTEGGHFMHVLLHTIIHIIQTDVKEVIGAPVSIYKAQAHNPNVLYRFNKSPHLAAGLAHNEPKIMDIKPARITLTVKAVTQASPQTWHLDLTEGGESFKGVITLAKSLFGGGSEMAYGVGEERVVRVGDLIAVTKYFYLQFGEPWLVLLEGTVYRQGWKDIFRDPDLYLVYVPRNTPHLSYDRYPAGKKVFLIG